jgi:hypothetical protein
MGRTKQSDAQSVPLQRGGDFKSDTSLAIGPCHVNYCDIGLNRKRPKFKMPDRSIKTRREENGTRTTI